MTNTPGKSRARDIAEMMEVQQRLSPATIKREALDAASGDPSVALDQMAQALGRLMGEQLTDRAVRASREQYIGQLEALLQQIAPDRAQALIREMARSAALKSHEEDALMKQDVYNWLDAHYVDGMTLEAATDACAAAHIVALKRSTIRKHVGAWKKARKACSPPPLIP